MRVESDGDGEFGAGLREPSGAAVGDAEIVVRRCQSCIQGDRIAQAADRAFNILGRK